MEQHPPTVFIAPDPPPFPAPPRSVDLSPLEFILGLIAVIAVPALIYTFFFSIKCPPSPFRRSQRHSSRSNSNASDIVSAAGSENPSTQDHQKDQISDVKSYQKEKHAKDSGIECPVCLSVFADGEEVKQLSVCKHSFHTSCIDLWLNSHSNCPVCRAAIAVNKSPNTTTRAPPSSRRAMEDLHQGLPDASSLV